MAEDSIAALVRKCLGKFTLLENIETPLDSDQKAVLEIVEKEARFKIWSSNIGAHSTGRRSLQYRLRDASHLQKQVISLLDELSELLADAYAIVIGEKVPWDRIEDDELSVGSDSESESGDVPATEMGQIAQNSSDTIDCLLRMSVAIRNPAPHDRFATFVSIDASHYEPFDIQHVKSKFSEIESFLADRLGRAISRRRQYFKYREIRQLKLSQGLDCQEAKDAESTVASSLPQPAKESGFSLELVDAGETSDSGVTHTSFSSSHIGGDKICVPPLPYEAKNGAFECPFCYMAIKTTSPLSWKRHVFADLRPYVCLSKDCTSPETEFMRRREWILHEVQNHWTMYSCPCSCGEVFPAKAQCFEHIGQSHPGAFPKEHVSSMIDLSTKPMKFEHGIICPLCKESLHSLENYHCHVGRHQERLALFALPPIDTGEDNEQLEGDATVTHSRASSGIVQQETKVINDEQAYDGSHETIKSAGREAINQYPLKHGVQSTIDERLNTADKESEGYKIETEPTEEASEEDRPVTNSAQGARRIVDKSTKDNYSGSASDSSEGGSWAIRNSTVFWRCNNCHGENTFNCGKTCQNFPCRARYSKECHVYNCTVRK